MYQNIKEKAGELKEIIFVLLLTIWMMIPVLKGIKITCIMTIKNEYAFIQTVGFIGLLFFIFDIYKNYQKAEDKKKYYLEILPIMILLVFMIWTFICSLFSSNINNAFFGTEYRKDGYISYLAYAGFFACAFLIKSKEKRKILLNIFVIMAILNIITVELHNRGVLTKVFIEMEINRTCFFNSNHYGYYLLLATITANFLFIAEKNKVIKIIYLLSYSFLLYYIMLNNTFGCYLAIAFTLILFMIYCLYRKKDRTIALVSIIIFLIMSFSSQDVKTITLNNINNLFGDIRNILIAAQIKDGETQVLLEKAENGGSGRIRIWKYGIKFFLQSPIIGYGPENLESKYNEVGVDQDRPHNLLIQLATTSGIIGLFSYMLAIGIILIRGIKTLKRQNEIHIIALASIIAYLISAMFGNSMYYTSPYFFIFLGFLMYENIKESKKIEK